MFEDLGHQLWFRILFAVVFLGAAAWVFYRATRQHNKKWGGGGRTPPNDTGPDGPDDPVHPTS